MSFCSSSYSYSICNCAAAIRKKEKERERFTKAASLPHAADAWLRPLLLLKPVVVAAAVVDVVVVVVVAKQTGKQLQLFSLVEWAPFLNGTATTTTTKTARRGKGMTGAGAGAGSALRIGRLAGYAARQLLLLLLLLFLWPVPEKKGALIPLWWLATTTFNLILYIKVIFTFFLLKLLWNWRIISFTYTEEIKKFLLKTS